MTPKITIAFVTGRRDPKVSWFVDSLFNQTTPTQRDNIQLVFVDGHCWSESQAYPMMSREMPFTDPAFHEITRRRQVEAIVAGRFDYLHIPPKPCAYQGPFRQTKRDMFCASNSRNSAFIVAKHPYVVFVDDLSVLVGRWFDQVLHAAEGDYVAAGAYKKVLNLEVENGAVRSYKEHFPGIDSRWDRGSDSGVVPWHGGALFGCSFGVPLEAALEVDGNDAACNGCGAEDTDFGIRLERAGWPIFYNRNMLTLESEELHHDGSKLPQERRLVTAYGLPKGYDSYQHVNAAEKYWSDHVMLNRIANETDRILPIIGDNLRQLRTQFFATGLVPIPEPNMRDWRDGVLLSEL